MNIREVLNRTRSRITADQEARDLLDFILNNEGDSDTRSLVDEIDTAYNG